MHERIMRRRCQKMPVILGAVMGLALASIPFVFHPRVTTAGPPPVVTYEADSAAEYYFDLEGFFCAFGVRVTTTGAGPSDTYRLRFAMMLDNRGEIADEVFALDPSFQPLVLEGVPVIFERDPCQTLGGVGDCGIARGFPAPPTHRWIAFRSTQPIPATPGDSTYAFVIESLWDYTKDQSVRDKRSAVWVTDDRDDRLGYVVHDFHEAGSFPYMIPECQGSDTDAYGLLLNGSGDTFQTIDANAPLTLAMMLPSTGGNGRFLVHLDAGIPDPFTVTELGFGLGNACHPFLLPPAGTASPASVWNNIGKESLFGETQWFGEPADPPERAPTFFHAAPDGDLVNLPAGSQWTLQGIIVNPAASSPRGASVTNAIEFEIE